MVYEALVPVKVAPPGVNTAVLSNFKSPAEYPPPLLVTSTLLTLLDVTTTFAVAPLQVPTVGSALPISNFTF